ncbi:MAG: CDP-alcohol phosphatidyltransferase family protein [candidate division KSB1 bacterium]|nr:CDP-alcohol phosphatidyltransferase family protein [candidate division KSB1 bacterium]
MLKGQVFTIANFFSFLRILVVWPIVVQLQRNTPQSSLYALYLMLFGIATDFLDGFFARKFHQRSDVGRVIDPLADKIAVAAVAYVLMQTRGMPVWFFALLIGRDLAILCLAPIMMKRIRAIPESNWYGKIAVTVIALVFVLYTLNASPWNLWALYLSLIFIVLSSWSYLVRFIRLIKETPSAE